MGKFLRNLLIASVVLVAIVAVLPFIVPLESYRGQIETAARNSTGRALHIEGPLRLTFFPHFGLKAEQVTFANMPGGRAAAMAKVGDITLSIRILPLLTGQVYVDKIVLDRPVVAFEVDSAGHANWNLSSPAKPAHGGSSVTLPATTQFSGIEIVDGRIAYDNFKTGTHRALEHVNTEIAITRLDQPLALSGNLDVGGGRVDFVVHLATVQAMLNNGTASMDISLSSDALKAGFRGVMAPDGSVVGDANLSAPSLRGAAQALGETLPSGGRFGAAAFSAHVTVKDKVVSLAPLHLSLDGQHIDGKLTLDEHSAIPAIDATLAADRLDLNPFVASGRGGSGAPAGRPSRRSSGWSNEPIDLSLLKAVNLKLTLATGGLMLRELRLGKLAATVSLDNGSLVTHLDHISLYGGTGQAELDVDARGPSPVFRNTLDIQHVSLSAFLNDAIGIDSIEGLGALTLNVTAKGDSANAAMHSLSGSGRIAGADGHIRGVDLGLVSRTIQTVLSGGATSRAANTGFHDMGGTFTLADGVLSNGDFHISGPIVQMTGAGQIDIGNRGINFRLVPKAGAGGLSIGIPFRVTGSWDHVHYMPDLSGIVNGVLQDIKTGTPLKAIFGGANQGRQNGKQKKSNGLLHGVFGIP